MAEEGYRTKKEVTINKWLIIGLVFSAVINVLFLLSSKFTINPWIFALACVVIIVFAVLQFLLSSKPKKDVFAAVADIRARMQSSKLPGSYELDTAVQNWRSWPIGENRFWIHFKAENTGFIYDNGVVTGKDPRDYIDVLKAIEKSKIYDKMLDQEMGTKKKREIAKRTGIDPKELGLTEEEED